MFVQQQSHYNKLLWILTVLLGILTVKKPAAAANSAHDANVYMMLAGYSAVSILSSRGRLTPLRMGFTWDDASERYALHPLLRAVEPPTAALLDLPKLAAAAATYFPSRNRQTHLYAVNERANVHSIALKRLFLR